MLASVVQEFAQITNRLMIGSAGSAERPKVVVAISNVPKRQAQMALDATELSTFITHLKRQAELTFGVKL